MNGININNIIIIIVINITTMDGIMTVIKTIINRCHTLLVLQECKKIVPLKLNM